MINSANSLAMSRNRPQSKSTLKQLENIGNGAGVVARHLPKGWYEVEGGEQGSKDAKAIFRLMDLVRFLVSEAGQFMQSGGRIRKVVLLLNKTLDRKGGGAGGGELVAGVMRCLKDIFEECEGIEANLISICGALAMDWLGECHSYLIFDEKREE